MQMLRSITLRNLATISDTSLEFSAGLNVLTGETGSGKSILVDGLMLATGKRADRSLVRPGTRTASVEAVFLDSSGEERTVRREVSVQGKSRVFIDDSLSTLDDVREAVRDFIELHSQRSTPHLLKQSKQLELLDRFAGIWELREKYTCVFQKFRTAEAELRQLESFLGESGRNMEILLHEEKLFHELKPSVEDYASLIDQEKSIRRVASLSSLYSESAEKLQSDDGVISSLGRLLSRVRKESPESSEIIALLEQASISASEAASLLVDMIFSSEEAPARMAEISGRLDSYSSLISRFGGSLQATLDAGRKVGDRLAEYNNAETRIQELQSEISTLSDELVNMADELTEKRTASAVEFSSRIVTELRALNMPLAEFHIERSDPVSPVTVKDRLVSVSGGESFSFLFTANTGMPAAALDSVASGGELSRVALALALIMADRGTASTLIFDEIDSGTGGETAHRLADSLVRASGARQIIVISHLAQVASRAFRHLAVEKRFEDGMPVTVVNHLNSPDSRISELARLLGGGDGARDHAVRLLKDWND